MLIRAETVYSLTSARHP